VAAPDAVDVRRLRRSAFLAGLGDGVVAVALPLLAAGVTRDPLAIAAVVAAQHLPWPLLALALPSLAGADRRTLAGAGDSARAIALGLAGLQAVVGTETLLTIQLVAFVVGIAQALTDDTERVGGQILRDRGGEAHATLAGAGMAGLAIVGLPIGGVLYELLAPIPLLFVVGIFAVAALFALGVRRPLLPPAAGAAPRSRSLLPRLAPGTVLITAAAALASAAAGAVAGVLVLIALDDLGLGAPAFGFLLTGLAASSLVGGLLAPSLGRRPGVRYGGALGLAVAAAALVAARVLLDPDGPYPAIVALGVAAAGSTVATVLLRAQRHGAVSTPEPDALRAYSLAVWTAMPLGALMGGVLARSTAPEDVLLLAAGAAVIAAAVSVTARTGSSAGGEEPGRTDGPEPVTEMP
jgi:hypothetical protein